MDIKGTILRAKDGHPVPVLEREEGLKRHLGSMYDGAVAASCWCEKVASKRTENIILFGMGDCRIVLELIEKVPGQILDLRAGKLCFFRRCEQVICIKKQ